MTCGKPCGCPSYRDHLLSIAVAPSATPSRGGGARAAEVNAMEAKWQQDHAAYRRLVKDGMQPKSLNHAADLERFASSKAEVEHGLGAPKELGELDAA